MGISTPTAGSKTREGIATKLEVSNYVRDSTLPSKYRVWELWVCVGSLNAFFRFFISPGSPTGRQGQGWQVFAAFCRKVEKTGFFPRQKPDWQK